MAEISLAALDDSPSISFDPRVWEGNLAAIKHVDSDLAEKLELVSIPPSLTPATTLDGFATYRELTDSGIRWLGGSSTPVKRAEPYVAEFSPGEANVALPILSAGAELRQLLDKCPTTTAVFVFVEEPLNAVGFLRLHDVAREVRELRCVLLTPGQEEASLGGILSRHEGLLEPGSVLRVANVAADRMQFVLDVCNRAARETSTRRTQAIQKLAARPVAVQVQAANAVRCAIVSMTADERATAAAGSLASAGRLHKADVLELTIRNPADVHPLRFCTAVSEFEPNLTICVNQGRTRLPIGTAGMNFEWWTSPVERGANLGESSVPKLAASPVVEESLRNAGAKTDLVIPFYWAAPDGLSAGAAVRDEVWIVADLPDATDRACVIDLPTHVLLWTHVRRSAESLLASGTANPVAILTHAERASGVEMKDAATRTGFLNLIASVMVPAVILEKLVEVLEAARMRVRAWGTDWNRINEQVVRVEARSAASLSDAMKEAVPIAALFYSARDALHPLLPTASVSGCPIVVLGEHSVVGKQLGGVLEPGRHVEIAVTVRDAASTVQVLAERADRRERLVERARAHVVEGHLMSHRWEELKNRVRGAAGASC